MSPNTDNVRRIVMDLNGAYFTPEAITRLFQEMKKRELGPFEWAQAHTAQHVNYMANGVTVDIVFDPDPKKFPEMVNNRPVTIAGIPFHRNDLMKEDEIEFFGQGLLLAKVIHAGVPKI
jgi:hypothetical protein